MQALGLLRIFTSDKYGIKPWMVGVISYSA